MLASFLFLTLALAVSANSQFEVVDGLPDFIQRGNCKQVQALEKFDYRRYSGRWYQTEIIPNGYMSFVRCINSFYEYSPVMNGYNVRTEGLDNQGESSTMEGKFHPVRKFPASHMLIEFPTVVGCPMEIVDTDYDTYSCVVSCMDWNTYKTEFAFVLSRRPENGGAATDKCRAVFKKNGVDFNAFVSVPHTQECVYRA